jgi:hypothetical protein
MTTCLIAAGAYNLAWGALTVLFPDWLFSLTGMERPNYPFIWQCVGMIVGVYGIGYLAAARDPARHWPIVLVGLLGKIFGPVGYVMGVVQGTVPAAFGVTIPTNDLIWWIPFAAILMYAFRVNTDTAGEATAPDLETALAEATTQSGTSLAAVSRSSPVLLVLLRHSGCIFCREAIADLAAALPRIEAAGLRLVVVHQGADDDIRPLLARCGIERIDRISDPGSTGPSTCRGGRSANSLGRPSGGPGGGPCSPAMESARSLGMAFRCTVPSSSGVAVWWLPDGARRPRNGRITPVWPVAPASEGVPEASLRPAGSPSPIACDAAGIPAILSQT